MKPSEICKKYGITLKKLSEITGQSEQTLINWHKNKRELFVISVIGAAFKKDGLELETQKDREAGMSEFDLKDKYGEQRI